MQGRPNACTSCVHWSGTMPDPDTEEWPNCAAFPEGIPMIVWTGRSSHADAIEGDHGLQWQIKDPERAAIYLAYWMETAEETEETTDE